MEWRSRYRSRSEFVGNIVEYVTPGQPQVLQTGGPYEVITRTDLCEDWHEKSRRFDGTLPPSDLMIRSVKTRRALVTCREYWHGKLSRKFENIPMSIGLSMANAAPVGGWASIEKSDTEYVAKLLARSNPFSYEVSVPVMIFELLEIGSLLSVAGANALASGGKAWLSNEFGIQPFMSDIRKLHDITKTIERKISDLNSLIRRGGLRTKVFLDKHSVTDPMVEYTGWSTWQKVFYVRAQRTYTSKVWGTCRWRPKLTSEIDIDKLVSVNNAIKVVLDLKTPDWSTIWEMIPFSWLVDYFLNVGDTLQALERSTLVEPYDICIMRQRTASNEMKVVRPPASWFDENPTLPRTRSFESSDGKQESVVKLRKANIATPTGYSSLLAYGFLSKSQAQNLTALLLAFNRFRP